MKRLSTRSTLALSALVLALLAAAVPAAAVMSDEEIAAQRTEYDAEYAALLAPDEGAPPASGSTPSSTWSTGRGCSRAPSGRP